METKSGKYQLCVLEGMQQGSQQVLRLAQAQSVGNSFDCDIYLHDDSESVHQVQILPGRFSMGITLVSGMAILDSKSMVVGRKYKLNPGTPVRLGESLFTVDAMGDKPNLSDVSVIHSEFSAQNSEDNSEHASALALQESTDEVVPDTRLIHRLYRPVYLIVFIGLGLIGSVFAAWRSGPIQVAPIPVSAVETQAADTPVVTASVAAEIENSVIDVFRTYGVNAEASSISTGIVTVKTNSTDTSKLVAAEASANADVYGLKKLIVDHDRLAPEEIKSPQKIISKEANQEIRMIVIGNPTYVVADNQSRYFKGSKLPTGHRVADIQKGMVIVEKNGVTTELKL